MKKVLLGLVVAVMMTGSGYAQASSISSKENCDYLSKQADIHFSLSKILEEGGRVVSVKVAPNNAKATNNIKESVLEMGFFQHLEVAKTYLDIYAHVCN